MVLPRLANLRNNPKYTISETNGEVIVQSKKDSGLVGNRYIFTSSGKLLSGYEKQLLDSGNPYYKKRYGATEGGKLEERTFQSKGSTVRLLEREVYTDGQRTEYLATGGRTELQKVNLYKQGRLAKTPKGKYVPVGTEDSVLSPDAPKPKGKYKPTLKVDKQYPKGIFGTREDISLLRAARTSYKSKYGLRPAELGAKYREAGAVAGGSEGVLALMESHAKKAEGRTPERFMAHTVLRDTKITDKKEVYGLTSSTRIDIDRPNNLFNMSMDKPSKKYLDFLEAKQPNQSFMTQADKINDNMMDFWQNVYKSDSNKNISNISTKNINFTLDKEGRIINGMEKPIYNYSHLLPKQEKRKIIIYRGSDNYILNLTYGEKSKFINESNKTKKFKDSIWINNTLYINYDSPSKLNKSWKPYESPKGVSTYYGQDIQEIIAFPYGKSSKKVTPTLSKQAPKKTKLSDFNINWDKTIITDTKAKKASFEQRVETFTEAEKKYYGSKYFQTTEKWATGIEVGARLNPLTAFMAKDIKAASKLALGLPAGMVGLGLFTPKKAAFTGEALAYPETRANVGKAYIRAGIETSKIYDVRTPEGRVTLAMGLMGGIAKGTSMIKKGYVGFVKGKTKVKTITTTYTPRIIEQRVTKVTGKHGNIKTVTFNVGEYTSKGRAEPLTYLNILGKKGKVAVGYPNLIYDAADIKAGYIGTAGAYYPKHAIQISLATAKRIPIHTGKRGRPALRWEATLETPQRRSITAAHEIIHSKTPAIPFESYLPYKYQPSEIIAYGLEKRVASRGFSITSADKALLNQPFTFIEMGDLKFKYPRQLKTVSRTGNTRAVSITTGQINKGLMKYQVKAVTVGRRTTGSITPINFKASPSAVFFKAPKARKLTVRYLEPVKLQPRWMREFKEQIASRGFFKEISTEPRVIKSTKKVPYRKPKIKFKREEITKANLFFNEQIDIAAPKGKTFGETALTKRYTQRGRLFMTRGESHQFINLRDVRQGFMGKAKSMLSQADRASLHYQRTTIGGRKGLAVKVGKKTIIVGAESPSITHTLRYPNIEYSFQPTYKSNLKTYGYDVSALGTRIPIVTYTKQPVLSSLRQQWFTSKSTYVGEVSRVRPFKAVLLAAKEIVSPMFKSKKASLKGVTIGRPVKVYVPKPPKPKTFYSSENIVLPVETVRKIASSLTSKGKTVLYPVIAPKIKSEIDTKIKPEVKITPKIKPEVKITPKIRPEIKITQRITPEVRLNIDTRINTEIRTKTYTRTYTPKAPPSMPTTRIPTPTITPITTITPPPILLPPKRRSKQKRKGEEQLVSFNPKYFASVEATVFKIKGKMPTARELATGLNIRPMVKV